MLLLQSLQDDGDQLDVGVSDHRVYLIGGGTRAPAHALGVGDLILQLARVLVNLLQQVSPAGTLPARQGCPRLEMR